MLWNDLPEEMEAAGSRERKETTEHRVIHYGSFGESRAPERPAQSKKVVGHCPVCSGTNLEDIATPETPNFVQCMDCMNIWESPACPECGCRDTYILAGSFCRCEVCYTHWQI